MKLKDIVIGREISEQVPAPMSTTAPTGQPPTATPLAGQPQGGLDPQQAAMAAKQRTDQKKQIQDQIKQAEQNLQNLRKQLADLG